MRAGRTFHINNNPISKKSLQQYVDNGSITQEDFQILNAYIAEQRSSRNLSQGRVNKIIFSLLAWRRFAPPFREATIFDIHTGIENIKAPDVNKGKPFAQNTIHDVIVILKPFYLWLIEEGSQ